MAGSYIDTLSGQAKQNAKTLLDEMKAKGITNPYTHAAILAVVSKESGFIPKSENMNYTSAESIARVFGLSKTEALNYVGKPKELGDYVYGPKRKPTLGNGEGEGYKYRGSGFNQLTGKANYKKYGQAIGVDLVSNPSKMNEPKIASDVAIEFFKNGVRSLSALGKLGSYNAKDINDFKNAKDALGAMYHINAGVGQTSAHINADVTGGKAKAESRIDDILKFVGGAVTSTPGKMLMFFFALSLIGVGAYISVNKS